ncbi:MAG: molecular chaperone HtpG [Chitinispirillaceae bacterium]|nr:molecular chaperone HtpG [Chitinispirillaceae bacterium]
MAETETATSTNEPQKMEFQTEARQLLHLMIHALYSHKEVFVRELVSNASDALDKLRFEALTNPSLLSSDTELAIRIKLDKTAKTITISDNGIGMTRQEVIENIGTIARSGSKAFLEKMTGDQKADSNLIGQFGVGFYSVFMVASSVKLVTKRAGSDEPAVVWESSGESSFTINDAEKASSGTDIVIYLKEDESTYAEDWQIRSLIKKYSDFIAFPIYLPNDKGADEIINQTKPIWKRPASEITSEQYEEFFHQALGGFDKPLATLHSQAEGIMEYSSLLFIPEKAPFDLFSMERKHGVKLYVKRVFIMDNCKELLPDYLRFVRGIIDSEDLPLNVSREILQKNPVIDKIRKAIVSKILGRLKEMAETEPDNYKKFWQNFGPVIKEGLHTDYENKEKLLELLRFQSSNGATSEDTVSLKQYVERMRTDQKDIYYIIGENRSIVEKSPHLEVFKSKSIEVLYMVDPIDEFIVPDIYNYDGKQLKSVTQGNLDLGDLAKEEKSAIKKAESKFKKLSERIKNILADSVKEVRVTTRLTDSPACLVTDENEMSSHMEKMMKAMGQEVTKAKPILEINPEHSILANMNARYEKDPKDEDLEDWVKLLFDQATIAEGQMVADPLAYSKRVNKLLSQVSGQ